MLNDKKTPLEKAEELITIGISLKHTTAVREELDTTMRKTLREGMVNGSQGLKLSEPEVEKKCLTQAEASHKGLSQLIAAKIEECGHEADKAGNDYRHAEDNLHDKRADQGYFSSLSAFTMQGLSAFSRIFYNCCGVFLFFTDVVLSLELVRQGFMFPAPKEKVNQFEKLFTANWWAVLQFNWQTVLTALGVTALTVLLKYAVDRFVLSPYGADSLLKQRLNQYFTGNRADVDLNDKVAYIHRIEILKGLAIAMIAVCVMGLFYKMAIFRSNAMEVGLLTEQYERKIKQVEDSEMGTMDKINEKEKLKTTWKEEENTLRLDAKDNTRATIFWLTLLMPLTSAICFSIAGNYQKTRKKLAVMQEEINEASTDVEEKLQRSKKADGEKKVWTMEADWLGEKSWTPSFANQLVDLYNYGFKIGNTRPDLMQDIPDKWEAVEQFRNKRALFKTNKLLLNMNDHEK